MLVGSRFTLLKNTYVYLYQALPCQTCSSSGGNRRKSESQVGIHPVLPSPPSDVCVRAARRTLAAYLSSAVRGAVLASPRSATIMNSLGPLGRVMEVSQRCRPAGPTHGRSISLS